jgi:DNA invertase Pin-like site-specific DNA recombinase
MFSAINARMLNMLAAVARKDYEDRRRRQAQVVAKAKAAGLPFASQRMVSDDEHQIQSVDFVQDCRIGLCANSCISTAITSRKVVLRSLTPPPKMPSQG